MRASAVTIKVILFICTLDDGFIYAVQQKQSTSDMMRNEFSNKVRRRRKNNKTKICEALGTYVRHVSTLLVGCPVPSDSLPTNAAKLKLYANDVVENEIYINHF